MRFSFGMLRRPMLLCLLLLPALWPHRAAGSALDRYDVVEIAPVKTSIYLASVSLSVPQFVRHGQVYESAYSAKIFPYFFWNEKGRLRIDVTDETLRQFARGEPFSFSGRAIRDDGTERKVTGFITPENAWGGKVTVRVFVTRHHSLAFDTTYRLAGPAQAGSQ